MTVEKNKPSSVEPEDTRNLGGAAGAVHCIRRGVEDDRFGFAD
jgi:hypothetical protein